MSRNKPGTRELVALCVASLIVLANAIYWIVQIKGVREMLQLAYGE